jgi:hypothetical protein
VNNTVVWSKDAAVTAQNDASAGVVPAVAGATTDNDGHALASR